MPHMFGASQPTRESNNWSHMPKPFGLHIRHAEPAAVFKLPNMGVLLAKIDVNGTNPFLKRTPMLLNCQGQVWTCYWATSLTGTSSMVPVQDVRRLWVRPRIAFPQVLVEVDAISLSWLVSEWPNKKTSGSVLALPSTCDSKSGLTSLPCGLMSTDHY